MSTRIGLAVIVFIVALESAGAADEPGKGIDRAKILKYMTSESGTVILFDDQGAVVSTDDKYVHDAMSVTAAAAIQWAKKRIPAVAAMKGNVMLSFSASGIGNRMTRQRAENVLDDLIRLQSRRAEPDPFQELQQNGGFKRR